MDKRLSRDRLACRQAKEKLAGKTGQKGDRSKQRCEADLADSWQMDSSSMNPPWFPCHGEVTIGFWTVGRDSVVLP